VKLETIERGLRNMPPEDLQVLARHLASTIAKAQRPPVRKLELFVTEDCNLRCDYCWVPKNARTMSPETAKQAIDFLLENCGDADSLQVVLFGGEPLLEFPLVREVVAYGAGKARAVGKTIGWSLTTNGTLVTREMVDFAQRHHLNYLLSLDGGRETHDRHRCRPDGRGSFEDIVKRLPILKGVQGWLGTRMTVTPDTVGDLTRSVQVLTDLGLNQFIIGDHLQGTWTSGHIAVLQEQWVAVGEFYTRLRSAGHPIRMTVFEPSQRDERDNTNCWGCEAGRDKITVLPSGDIYPCARFVDKAGIQDQFWLGHIDFGLTAERTRRELTDERDVIRYRCMKCGERSVCMGGCPATNYLCTGSPFVAPRIECAMRRFWTKLRRERPEFWEVSKIPYGPQPGTFGDAPGEQPGWAHCRPLN
jgi:uncharacterized protein